MAGGNMGELWFSLGIRSNIAQGVNKALRELNNVEGAVSKLNEKLIEARLNLKKALNRQNVDKKLVKNLREEVAAWEQGTKNALQYQGMLQKVNAELSKLSTLRNISIGVDHTKLDQAEQILQKFRRDLSNVTYERLGGTDSNTWMSNFRSALRLTVNDVHTLVDSFKRDNALTDAATRAARLQVALEGVRRKLLDISNLRSRGIKAGMNVSDLVTAGNKLRGIQGRIERMLKSTDLISNEAKYRALLSDIQVKSAEAATSVEKYGLAKQKAAQVKLGQDILAFNEAKVRDIQALLDGIQHRVTAITQSSQFAANGGKIGFDSNLTSKLQQLAEFESKLRNLNLGEKGVVGRLLKTENFGTLRNQINSLLSETERQIKQADRAASQSSENWSKNIEKVKAEYRQLYNLLAKLYEARNRGNLAGLDTTRLERDIAYVKELMGKLQGMTKTPSLVPSDKGYSFLAGTEGRLESVGRHIKANNQHLAAGRARLQESTNAAKELSSAFDRIHNSASKSERVFSDIKNLFFHGGLIYGAQAFFNQVVKTGGDIEQQHIALQSILGDVSKANELFDQTKRLALESPFTFGELNRDVKQLSAFGVEADNLYDTTKRLADIASGLGVSFERIGLAYGQTKARTWLDAKELRQFAYAGLPLLQKLTEYYNATRGDKTYTTRDVRDMIQKREVGFEDVDAVIKKLTNVGGQFYNLQYTLSKTLLGQYNKMIDAWDIMLGQLASGTSIVGRFFKLSIQGATALIQSVDNLGGVFVALFSGYAMKRLFSVVGGSTKRNLLSAKDSIGNELLRRKIVGEQLNAAELRLLRTKKLITAEDLKILLQEKQITKTDLQRLYITGQITTALYKQGMAMTGLTSKSRSLAVYWRAFMIRLRSFSFSTFGPALWGGLKAGATNLAKGLWGMIGGLPGFLVTAGTMLAAKIYQANQNIQDAINRINEEQNARYKSIDDFLSNNPLDAAKAGSEKDRLAAIENYKEKLIEVAPYNKAAYEMQDSEKKSHEERLNYLSQELELIRKANDYVTRHSDNLTKNTNDEFEDVAKGAGKLQEIYATIEKRLGSMHIEDIKQALPRMYSNARTTGLAKELDQAIKSGETLEQLVVRIKREVFSANGKNVYQEGGVNAFARGIFGNGVVGGYNLPNGVDKYAADYYDQAEAFKKKVAELKKAIAEEMPNVGKDPIVTEAYKQFRESLEGQMQLSPKEKEMINISLDEAFGIPNNDLQLKLAEKLRGMIDQTIPEIAAKIRSGKELNEADKAKVRELMNVAADELGISYSIFESKLQGLLDGSHFEATIHLGFDGDEWNDLQKRFYNNLPSILNDETKYHYTNIANSWTKGNSMYEARNAAKAAIDQAKNEMEAEKDALKKGKASQADVEKAQKAYQDYVDAALYGLGYDYEGELKKSNKANNSAETARNRALAAARKADNDDERRLRARLQLIKKAYATYQKYYKLLHSKSIAAAAVSSQYKDKGLSNEDVANITSDKGYLKLIDDYIAMAKAMKYRRPEEMKERKDADIAEGVKERNDFRYNDLSQNMEEFASSMDRAMGLMTRRWNVYKSVLSVTNDRDYAAVVSGISKDANGIAMENGMQTGGYVTAYSQYLRNLIEEEISKTSTPLNVPLESFYQKLPQMSNKQIEEYVGNAFGQGDADKVKGFVDAFKKLRDILSDSEYQEGMNTFKDLLGKIVTTAAISDRADAEFNDTQTKLKQRLNAKDITQDDYDTAIAIADAIRNDKNLKASVGYASLMNRAYVMGNEEFASEYQKALENLNEQMRAGIITAEEYADREKKLHEIERKRNESKLFGKINDLSIYSKSGLHGLQDYYYDKIKERKDELKENGFTDEQIDNDKDLKDFKDKYKNVGKLIDGLDDLSFAVSIVTGVFDGLGKAATELSNMFDALGNEKMANFFSDFSDVTNAIGSFFTPVSDIMQNAMSGNVGGVVSSVISAPVSMIAGPITGFAKLHDKKLDRQIQELQRVNKGIEDTRMSIERNLSNTLGGIYAYNSKAEDANKLGSSEYYQQEFASYKQQIANLQQRRHKEDKRKKTDKGKIQDYDAQINELQDKLKTLAMDMAKSIYDIDIKSWAKELTDAIVSAWASGEDAAEAYKNKVRDIMRQLASNIVAQKIMEVALKPVNDLIEIEMNANSGKLNEKSIEKIFVALEKAGDSAVSSTVNFFEYLKKRGYDLSVTANGSMSSSIKGITENTADLVASYLNAIRADVSVIRQMDGIYWPKLDVTTQAQLQQLSFISANTLRNADAAVEMKDAVVEMREMINRAQNDTKPFYVHVK